MPELPEVETTKRGIAPHITGANIVNIIIRQPQLRWPIPAEIMTDCYQKEILSVRRRAKYLLLELHHGTLIIHLGMSGRLSVIDEKVPAAKHDHVDFCFDNGLSLRFTDPRRFGCILWTKENVHEQKLLHHLGPEPLTDGFTAEYLHSVARSRAVAVKEFIMNAQIVVGVGNIYASEALFLAGIYPKRRASRISLQRYEKLVEAIKVVLSKAIEQGGTTLKDFRDSDGKPGYFEQSLNVYGREAEACTHCGGHIKMLRLGGRSTFYCGQCQT